MSIEISGFFGFVWMVASIWAIIRTVQSPASTLKKTLWVVAILLLPAIGVIAWFVFGPKG